MGQLMLKKFLAVAAFVALSIPAAASADVTWVVKGTFNDGGSLSGSFNINQYGYLDGYDLTTSGGSMPGIGYTPANSYYSNGNFVFDAQPGYQGDLHLEFLKDLSIAAANNPILSGNPGPSYECQDSYSCYDLQGGTTRFIAEGYASAGAVPEPGAWALMFVGFLGLGAIVRTSRRKAYLIAGA
jgi:hypothetical protein